MLKNEIKTGIIVGVIATIVFVYFVEPILNLLNALIVKVTNMIGGAYESRIFSQASHLETLNYSFILLIFFLILICAFFGFSQLISLNSFKLNQIGRVFMIPSEDKNYRKVFVTLSLFFHVSFIVVTTGNFQQLKIISSFKRHMRIVKPYIKSNEYDLLIKEWSLMSSRDNYDDIYRKILDIAKKHNIKLPEEDIYTLSKLTI